MGACDQKHKHNIKLFELQKVVPGQHISVAALEFVQAFSAILMKK